MKFLVLVAAAALVLTGCSAQADPAPSGSQNPGASNNPPPAADIFTSPEPGPLNMMSDGVKVGEGLDVVRTEAIPPNSAPVPSAENVPASVFDIRIYSDYMCPFCGAFEKANGAQIEQWVNDGRATVEIHPVSILDRFSKGSNYSTRSANAAACVANFASESFFAYNALLFMKQPRENTPGLSDAELTDLTNQVGVDSAFDDVSQCIAEQTFAHWVEVSTNRFTKKPFPNVQMQPEGRGTPTIFVNGQLYKARLDPQTLEFDPQEFEKFVFEVVGESGPNS